MQPSYLNLLKNGSLKEKADSALKMLKNCEICPRKCKINRLNDQKGFCKTGLKPVIYNYLPHFGEEPPISGTNGSGTIFFSNCNMGCIYCQNYEFSQLNNGREVEFEDLAGFMLRLQDKKCHNINLVTPTHVMPQIINALYIAAQKGLKIPVVYNTGGYELPEIIDFLNGVIDIYLPDMRYADNEPAKKYSKTPDYPLYNQTSIKKMHNQVGTASLDRNGIIIKDLIIRHLVLPENISGTKKIMEFIKNQISKETYISLMSQYLPCFAAKDDHSLNRRITLAEYETAKEIMADLGLNNGWIQESRGLERFAGINIKPDTEKL